MDYKQIALRRPDELTRRIQDKRNKAAKTTDTSKLRISTLLAAPRKRARNARVALKDQKAKVGESTKDAVA